MFKLFNKTHKKYLTYLEPPTADGTYTVLLMADYSGLPARFEWEKVPVSDEPGFNLKAPTVGASMVVLNSGRLGSAWLAKPDYAAPVKLFYFDGAISLDTGPSFLSAIKDDPYAYFQPDINDQWEFQPV